MPSLTTSPLEILLDICAYLPHKSLASLSQCCKYLQYRLRQPIERRRQELVPLDREIIPYKTGFFGVLITTGRLMISSGVISMGTQFTDTAEFPKPTTQIDWRRVNSSEGCYDLILSKPEGEDIQSAQLAATDVIKLSPTLSSSLPTIPTRLVLSTVLNSITELTILMDHHDTEILATILGSLGSLVILNIIYPDRTPAAVEGVMAVLSFNLPLIKVLRVTKAPPCKLTDLANSKINSGLQILDVVSTRTSDTNTLLTKEETSLAVKLVYEKLLTISGRRDAQRVKVIVCHLMIDENFRLWKLIHTWRRVSSSQLKYSVETVEVTDGLTKLTVLKRIQSSIDNSRQLDGLYRGMTGHSSTRV
ncbi:hypothetical protein TWF106_010715 [Orbilia oligospora]|uniref:F-box domain-containing protein n=1 Tax=Orbilia oligospora TaxID=2813651 RepID=A0A7C8QF49_ORBOL|nr:hypothetical protein TWF106_010715 [Orbilia oligospora]